MGVHGRRSAWRVAFCLLGALSVAVPSGAAGDDVPGAVLLVELETRATARVGVTYRQVRALATEEDRLVGDRLVLEAGGPDFESELLPGRRVAAGYRVDARGSRSRRTCLHGAESTVDATRPSSAIAW